MKCRTAYPWEQSNSTSQLRIELAAYQRACRRSEKWGGRLKQRRRRLRRLADESGEREQLELILCALRDGFRGARGV